MPKFHFPNWSEPPLAKLTIGSLRSYREQAIKQAASEPRHLPFTPVMPVQHEGDFMKMKSKKARVKARRWWKQFHQCVEAGKIVKLSENKR